MYQLPAGPQETLHQAETSNFDGAKVLERRGNNARNRNLGIIAP